ncbi:hypothetical protein ADUPG1_005800, partial [Aduncisulcus paluster]
AGGAAFIPSSTEVGGAGKAISGDLVDDITRKGNVSPGLPGSTEPGETALAVDKSHVYMACPVKKTKTKTSTIGSRAAKRKARMNPSKSNERSDEESSEGSGQDSGSDKAPEEGEDNQPSQKSEDPKRRSTSLADDASLLELVSFEEAPEDLPESP